MSPYGDTAKTSTESVKKTGGLAKPRGRKLMNKKAASFVATLKARVRNGELVSPYANG